MDKVIEDRQILFKIGRFPSLFLNNTKLNDFFDQHRGDKPPIAILDNVRDNLGLYILTSLANFEVFESFQSEFFK